MKKIFFLMTIKIFLILPFSNVLANENPNIIDKSSIETSSNTNSAPSGSGYGSYHRELIDGVHTYGNNGFDNTGQQHKKIYADLTLQHVEKISQINIAVTSGESSAYQPRAGFDVYVSPNGEEFRRVFGTEKQYYTNLFSNNLYLKIEFEQQDVKKVRIQFRGDGHRGRITEVDFLKTPEEIDPYTNYENIRDHIDGGMTDIKPPGEIENLITTKKPRSIDLNYILPTDEDFSHVNIYINGQVYEVVENSYRVENLEPNTEYEIIIKTIDDNGNESEGVSTTVKTKKSEGMQEVKNIKVKPEIDRVNLSWELPETDHFEHVNIYRKDLGENDQETSVFDFLKPMTVHASNDDFKAIFETNGTYFNDLTVEENSKYEYKLTTEYQGLESQGVIVQATTPISPAPPLEGGGGEQQANGDYLFKWSSPREGQVRVFVDGTEYATVEASTGQLLVPGSDMKYSALGKPLISYQTIGLNGEESNITSPDISDLEIPVTPGDVIETGSQLIGIVSSFILLGLSFIFAPKLIKFIRQSFSNKKEDSGRGREREQIEQRESRTSIRETRQARQGRTRTRTARTYREGRA